MTQRDRVLDAINHKSPERVPFSWGLGITSEMNARMEKYLREKGIHWRKVHFAAEHVLSITPRYIGPSLPEKSDIWGVRRKKVNYGEGSYDEVEYYPLAGITDSNRIHNYPWPKSDWFDFKSLRQEVLQEDPDLNKARRVGIYNPFERLTWMAGLEEVFVNMMVYPDLVHAALEKITNFFVEMIERTVNACGDLIDIFYFADDLGGQTNLLISKDAYREVLQPYHKQLIESAKTLRPEAKAMYHSDGAVFDIIPELIDAGVEILEAVQTDAAGMDPKRLKKTYGDRLCFHGGISVQSLLPNRDVAMVQKECQDLIATFGENGGYIAAPTHAIQVGTPEENVMAMLETVLGEEEYKKTLRTCL